MACSAKRFWVSSSLLRRLSSAFWAMRRAISGRMVAISLSSSVVWSFMELMTAVAWVLALVIWALRASMLALLSSSWAMRALRLLMVAVRRVEFS